MPAQLISQQLHAIANAEHRYPKAEHRVGEAGSPTVIHAAGPAGKDDAAGIEAGQFTGGGVPGEQLGVDITLTDATHNQLAILRSIVQHRNRIARYARVRHAWQILPLGRMPDSPLHYRRRFGGHKCIGG